MLLTHLGDNRSSNKSAVKCRKLSANWDRVFSRDWICQLLASVYILLFKVVQMISLHMELLFAVSVISHKINKAIWVSFWVWKEKLNSVSSGYYFKACYLDFSDLNNEISLFYHHIMRKLILFQLQKYPKYCKWTIINNHHS